MNTLTSPAALTFAAALMLSIGAGCSSLHDVGPVAPRDATASINTAARPDGPYVLHAAGVVVEATGKQSAWFDPVHSERPLTVGMRAEIYDPAFPAEEFDGVVSRVGQVEQGQIVFKLELAHPEPRLVPGHTVTAYVVIPGGRRGAVARLDDTALGGSHP
ncbi:MAG TPA: hypothetical protein VJT73_10500 [Polyangiaceae bacterium]|nr:hypothetical protein [Polyangiaceae bacterium]